MSKHKAKIKEIINIKGNIWKIVINIERPVRLRNGDTEMKETNKWVYIGTPGEWISEDGLSLPPGDPILSQEEVSPDYNHFAMCNRAVRFHVLKSRYKQFLKLEEIE